MALRKKRVVVRRHLVCGNCASWVHYETGCEKKWADIRAEGFVFTCKGCTEVAVLVKEVSGVKRKMMEDLKETVAGLQLDDKGAETGSRVTTTGVSQDREETAGTVEQRTRTQVSRTRERVG